MTNEYDQSLPQNDQPAVHPAATDLITQLVRTHLRHTQDAKKAETPDQHRRPTPTTNNPEAQPDA